MTTEETLRPPRNPVMRSMDMQPRNGNRWVRGEHWRYKFSQPGGKHASEGKWWARKRIGPYFPPLRLEDLKDYFQARGWPLEEPM